MTKAWWVFAFFLAACAPKVIQPAFIGTNFKPPNKVAVLPLANETNSVSAPGTVRDNLVAALTLRGYPCLYNHEVDEKLLREFGISLGEQLKNADFQAIGRALGVDALVYGCVLSFNNTPIARGGKSTVKLNLKLVDTRTGHLLWEDTDGARYGQKFIDQLVRQGNVMPETLKRQQQMIEGTYLIEHTRFVLKTMVQKLPIGPSPHVLTGQDPWIKSSVPALLESLSNTDSNVRYEAVMKLVDADPSILRIVPALEEFLKSEDAHTRWLALEAIEKTGTNAKFAAPTLVHLLNDPKDSVRYRAALLISKLKVRDPALVLQLIPHLNSDDKKIKKRVIYILGDMGPLAKAALPQLSKLGKSEDPEVSSLSLSALAMIHSGRAR